jgi:hypothetical protein
MRRRTIFALPLAICAIAALLAVPAQAQSAKKVRGKVTTMTATSLAIDVAGTPMNFAVDAKTKVEAPGGSTATRKAEAAGKPGVSLTDVIKTGDAVEVSYTETGGKMQASMIRRVTSVGAATTTGGDKGAATTAAAARTTSGKVTAVSPTSITIAAAGAAAQTFAIDAKTQVIGRGVGTMAKNTGGKLSATDAIGNGDSVNVSFTTMNGTMHASEIRVISKAGK